VEAPEAPPAPAGVVRGLARRTRLGNAISQALPGAIRFRDWRSLSLVTSRSSPRAVRAAISRVGATVPAGALPLFAASLVARRDPGGLGHTLRLLQHRHDSLQHSGLPRPHVATRRPADRLCPRHLLFRPRHALQRQGDREHDSADHDSPLAAAREEPARTGNAAAQVEKLQLRDVGPRLGLGHQGELRPPYGPAEENFAPHENGFPSPDVHGDQIASSNGLRADIEGLLARLVVSVEHRSVLQDSCHTTAAIGKGFAIGSAALTSLALFTAYTQAAGIKSIDITSTTVIIGVFIGGMVPFLVASITMTSVGKGAFIMIEEIRRQFREIPGLMEGTGKPDTASCIDICTKAALREMVLPGVIAFLMPITVGFLMGKEALGGMLVGAMLVGVLLALFMSNGGGAWDNAKKYVESGHLGGKGSEAHKATVVGDTVGDPLKDTSGPAMNILIKLMSIVSLVLAPLFI
jgi:hypothetical protein